MATVSKRPGRSATNRKEMILREATHLFANRGFDGTPVRTIARACGVTEAAIYRHYENKEHLYGEVVRAKATQYDIPGRLAALDTSGDVERLLTVVAEYVLAFAQDDPELLQLMGSSCRVTDRAAAVLFREVRMPIISFIRNELDRRRTRGEIVPVDTLITARCFVGMVMDCAMCVGVWGRLNEAPFSSRDVIANNVPIFARGLRVAKDGRSRIAGAL